MQTLYVNTNTQQSFGDDTNFVVQLQQSYRARKIRLNSFCCPNFFSNFGVGFTDFSFQTAGGTTTVTISQIQLTLDDFFTYINSVQNDVVFSYVDNYGVLTITGDVAWSPRKDQTTSGWSKLGFLTYYTDTNSRALATSQVCNTYFDMSQSQYIFIRFNNLTNSYVGPDFMASFRIPLAGTSAFLEKVLYEDAFQEINQQVEFTQLTSFNQLNITLVDGNNQPLQTQNNNGTDMEIQMTLGLYEQ